MPKIMPIATHCAVPAEFRFCPPIRMASASSWRLIVVACVALALSTAVQAGKPDNVTEAEMAVLPPYCPDTQTFKYGNATSNPSPNAPKWVGLMGNGFWAMHHYCWALINLSRAQKPSIPANIRDAMRGYAIDDMKYVLLNTEPDFVLSPEIYTKIGDVELALNRPVEARSAYANARSLKPDYWPAYLNWAEYLRRSGDKAKARELVEEGLSYAPNAKSLSRLLIELGGNPSTVRTRPVPEPPSTTPGK